LEAHILRVADIFQAMVQDRPYRQGLTPAAVTDFMQEQKRRGSVDADITDILLAHLDEMFAVARLGSREAAVTENGAG